MPLTIEQQDEVNRAEALLTELSDEDKREVVRAAYVQPKGTLEESIQEKRDKLVNDTVRRGQLNDLATRTGLVLEAPPSVDDDVKNLVDQYDKAAVQAALDLLP